MCDESLVCISLINIICCPNEISTFHTHNYSMFYFWTENGVCIVSGL
jgi:hypothetical protein